MKLKLLPLFVAALFMVGCHAERKPTEPVEPETPIVEPSEPEPSEPEEPETPVEPVEPEVIPNDGSEEHPWTISEAYPFAAKLEDGQNTTEQKYFVGKVTGEVSFYKGRLSFDITDGEKTLNVYNMNNAENKASWKEDQTEIAEGVELIVTGALKNYKGKLEICYVKDVADCFLVKVIK